MKLDGAGRGTRVLHKATVYEFLFSRGKEACCLRGVGQCPVEGAADEDGKDSFQNKDPTPAAQPLN